MGGDSLAQPVCPILVRRDFKLQTKQIECRRCDTQAGYGGIDDRIRQGIVPDQHVIGGDFPVLAIDSQAGGRVALGIEIDNQNPLAYRGKRRAQIDCRRRFSHAALLIGQGQDAG